MAAIRVVPRGDPSRQAPAGRAFSVDLMPAVMIEKQAEPGQRQPET
jgi:hypothetical protein